MAQLQLVTMTVTVTVTVTVTATVTVTVTATVNMTAKEQYANQSLYEGSAWGMTTTGKGSATGVSLFICYPNMPASPRIRFLATAMHR